MKNLKKNLMDHKILGMIQHKLNCSDKKPQLLNKIILLKAFKRKLVNSKDKRKKIQVVPLHLIPQTSMQSVDIVQILRIIP
ncbi:hypothetical protein GLOIN_2v1534161 [Rhizophagus irregularis DAOM 181602=DAOM 197198]|uniref:Uncharacterized protein n=1 Tax=Rhizophagus irregularis (strain DAOM 181602 / DAOM 197198 / MUCL 43194) TaxID=747089 RepID=A0A2P4QMU4_RHIID|nr:hypothetical protein GLOIN_2v1534161 [Rhizophagus irregularis DAOM 181602=DAOM 197198]POG78956.1 hypothetical protein GLOIN_2v1534161 [Rhizophagus irregularis DAOM 181602=DAOM 197198]|eukprot:XP_025185822.1 hypothetical protein GLOIN_2v1534161 [Rhizophagus irregularis DAOM 181602=DAOM 197198]